MNTELSHKQFLYAEYLLRQIGFQESEELTNYLEVLKKVFGQHYEKTIWNKEFGKLIPKTTRRISYAKCIEQLVDEVKLKKSLNDITIKKKVNNNNVSATDLSNFNFCPVSYSIGKTFKIEQPTNEDKRILGSNFHEGLRLLTKKGSKAHKKNAFYSEQINKIKSCELLFLGHTEEKKFFQNQQMNFVGQPDYIFKDPKGQQFVVEEKFKYLHRLNEDEYSDPIKYDEAFKKNEQIKKTFFTNHIIQLQSYVDFINEYDLKYGILIYWFYDFHNNSPIIHSASIKVINKNENDKLLHNTLSELKYFLKEQVISFSKDINPNKCVSCTVNKYCSHKTNNFKKLKIPYNKIDMRLQPVEFPAALKPKK